MSNSHPAHRIGEYHGKVEPETYLGDCQDLAKTGVQSCRADLEVVLSGAERAEDVVAVLTNAQDRLDEAKSALRAGAKMEVPAIESEAFSALTEQYTQQLREAVKAARATEKVPEKLIKAAQSIARITRDCHVLAQRIVPALSAYVEQETARRTKAATAKKQAAAAPAPKPAAAKPAPEQKPVEDDELLPIPDEDLVDLGAESTDDENDSFLGMALGALGTKDDEATDPVTAEDEAKILAAEKSVAAVKPVASAATAAAPAKPAAPKPAVIPPKTAVSAPKPAASPAKPAPNGAPSAAKPAQKQPVIRTAVVKPPVNPADKDTGDLTEELQDLVLREIADSDDDEVIDPSRLPPVAKPGEAAKQPGKKP